MNMTFNELRTYGIEIEFTNTSMSLGQIASKMRLDGIDCQSEGYNHTTKSYWKLITDSSCGYEMVSPVLKGEDGFNQIKKVCKVLNECGCKVNKQCGLHVHHGVMDYDLSNFKNLYIMYTKYERSLDSILPMSRRATNNRYCGSMLSPIGYDWTIQKLNACKSVRDIQNMYGTRYKKLNIESYVKYGTIEFRQHSGTLEADKIINWIMLTQAMVTKAKFGRVVKTSNKEYNEIGYLLHVLGVLKKENCSEQLFEMGKFYKTRMKQLFQQTGVAA